jgi:hypothetical protein
MVILLGKDLRKRVDLPNKMKWLVVSTYPSEKYDISQLGL